MRLKTLPKNNKRHEKLKKNNEIRRVPPSWAYTFGSFRSTKDINLFR